MSLKGKVVLVTGGAQRVGRFISLSLAREGATVVINHFRTGEDAAETQKEIENAGCVNSSIIECDITNIKASGKMIDEIDKRYGRLDILVHNASNFNMCPFMEVTEALWNSSLDVNLKGPFFLSQAAAKLMLKNKAGRIIALVGNSYFENWPDFIPHTIAKTGLAKLIQSLSITLSPYIQCNAICPAAIFPSEDDQQNSIFSTRDEKVDKNTIIANGVELHKGTPEEVTELIIYLSTCSPYMNGAIIPIDGGKNAI